MSDLQLSDDEEQEFSRPVPITAPSQPTFVRLTLATGLVKTEKQAEYVLAGMSLLVLIIAFFVWRSATPSFSGGINPQDPVQVRLMQIKSLQIMPNVRP